VSCAITSRSRLTARERIAIPSLPRDYPPASLPREEQTIEGGFAGGRFAGSSRRDNAAAKSPPAATPGPDFGPWQAAVGALEAAVVVARWQSRTAGGPKGAGLRTERARRARRDPADVPAVCTAGVRLPNAVGLRSRSTAATRPRDRVASRERSADSDHQRQSRPLPIHDALPFRSRQKRRQKARSAGSDS
jgi:hypothetical protein